MNKFFDLLKKNSTVLKFALSSFTCYAVEYALYGTFVTLPLLWGGRVHVTMSNVGARLVSSTMNFSLNRKFVFKTDGRRTVKFIEYFSLAAAVLFGSTTLLWIFVDKLGLSRYLSKLVIDTAFFVVNWVVQRFVIFKK